MLIDGRDLNVSFQRSAGCCGLVDVHELYATVREALGFSALLRQSRDTPKEERLKYADTIVDLLRCVTLNTRWWANLALTCQWNAGNV